MDTQSLILVRPEIWVTEHYCAFIKGVEAANYDDDQRMPHNHGILNYLVLVILETSLVLPAMHAKLTLL